METEEEFKQKEEMQKEAIQTNTTFCKRKIWNRQCERQSFKKHAFSFRSERKRKVYRFRFYDRKKRSQF